MKKPLRFIPSLVILFLALPAGADPGERFAIRGAGLLQCSNFVEERDKESPAYMMIGGWIDGYITAINQYREDTYDITSYEGTELIARLVDNHCRKNPDDRLFTVINALMERIDEHRVRESVESVTVRAGQQSTQLYKSTVLRIQHALEARGQYVGPTHGRFTPAVKEALAGFQREIGFEPNGFPDQATLWFLLGASGDASATGATGD
jgi:hypothetical protein